MKRAAVGLFVLLGCASPPPAPGGPACLSCHDERALFAPGPGDGLGAREWMEIAGSGLVLSTGVIPGPARFVLVWPRRGHHDRATASTCTDCHPVQADTTGHGLSQYPVTAGGFPDDATCNACHGWLSANASTSGFLSAGGTRPSYAGSLRPLDLLTSADNAHARIFRGGFTADATNAAALRVTSVTPGCVGCHALSSDAHGEIPSCTDCHRFGTATDPTSLAAFHAQRVADRQAAVDPAHVGDPNCAYCHAFDPTPDDAYRPACYNCHLSGHRPDAVFWPVTP